MLNKDNEWIDNEKNRPPSISGDLLELIRSKEYRDYIKVLMKSIGIDVEEELPKPPEKGV